MYSLWFFLWDSLPACLMTCWPRCQYPKQSQAKAPESHFICLLFYENYRGPSPHNYLILTPKINEVWRRGEEIWEVNTFIVISTPRKTGLKANAHSEEQIALCLYSRHQSCALCVCIWASVLTYKECKSESGTITNLAQVKSASWTSKHFWNSPRQIIISVLFPGSMSPAMFRPTRLRGQWKIPEWRGSFLSSPCSAELYPKKKKKKEFFLSTATKKKLKLYDL